MSLVVQSETSDEYLQKLAQTITIEEIEQPAIRRILFLLQEKKNIPSELSDMYNKAYLRDIQSITQDKQRFEEEFNQSVLNLKRVMLRRKLKTIATKLKESKNSSQLNNELSRISQQLRDLKTETI